MQNESEVTHTPFLVFYMVALGNFYATFHRKPMKDQRLKVLQNSKKKRYFFKSLNKFIWIDFNHSLVKFILSNPSKIEILLTILVTFHC